MVGRKYWYGVEVEGRLKGIKTCFVRSEIPKDVGEYPHVYFTYEWLNNFGDKKVNSMRELIKAGKYVTIEVQTKEEL